MKEQLLTYLSQFVTEKKKQRIDEVLSVRTRYVTVVVEDVYQPQNASAIIRTCECFGIQDLHIIENQNKYIHNPDVTLGSSKWVNVLRYKGKGKNNSTECIEALKSQGYKVYAASPHQNDILLEELPLDQKFALVFGNEKKGLSKEMVVMADGFVRIPMTGFTESLNVSVSAAVCVHSVISRIWKSEIDWKLSEEEGREIRLKWVKKIIKKSELLEKKFLLGDIIDE